MCRLDQSSNGSKSRWCGTVCTRFAVDVCGKNDCVAPYAWFKLFKPERIQFDTDTQTRSHKHQHQQKAARKDMCFKIRDEKQIANPLLMHVYFWSTHSFRFVLAKYWTKLNIMLFTIEATAKPVVVFGWAFPKQIRTKTKKRMEVIMPMLICKISDKFFFTRVFTKSMFALYRFGIVQLCFGRKSSHSTYSCHSPIEMLNYPNANVALC